MPKISVIVPVYNVEKYLSFCIDSILAQSFTDFELLLVNDGSTDSSLKICLLYKEKDKRIVVIDKQNGGLSSARNAGLDYIFQNSDSDYVSFIDSDDYVHPDFLKELFLAINGCELSLCRYVSVPCDCFSTDSVYTIIEKDDYWKLNNSDNGFTVNSTDKLFKRDIFSDIRYPVGRLFEDSFVIHKIISKCTKIAMVKKYLYFYRLRSDSIVHSHNEEKGMIDSLQCKYERIEMYFNMGDKKMFPVVFYDCFDYLTYSYQRAKKNKIIFGSIKELFNSIKRIYKDKKFTSLCKKKIKFTLFFKFPSMYLFVKRLKSKLNKK